MGEYLDIYIGLNQGLNSDCFFRLFMTKADMSMLQPNANGLLLLAKYVIIFLAIPFT